MVSGSPTVGGFAGYFANGITYSVAHMISDNTSAFFTKFLLGNTCLDRPNTIPNSAPIAVPSMVPAKTSPPFCQTLYE